jgi:membrane-associated phospholipid phosphatase
MPSPLVAARYRGAAWALIGAAALVTCVLAVRLHDGSATRFDRWALRRSIADVGTDGARFLLHCSDPALSFGVIAVVAMAAVLGRRWALVALAALGPGLAVLLTEQVLKPIIGRFMTFPWMDPELSRQLYSGAFPSGHETGVASAALLVLVGAGQLRLRPTVRAGLIVVLCGWTALAALGLIRNSYHYATDTFGAVGVSVVVVLGGALLIDRTAAAIARRRAPVSEPHEAPVGRALG